MPNRQIWRSFPQSLFDEALMEWSDGVKRTTSLIAANHLRQSPGAGLRRLRLYLLKLDYSTYVLIAEQYFNMHR